MRFIPFFVISLAVFLTACSQKKETAKPVQQKLPVISAGDQKAIINREISTWQFAKIKKGDTEKALSKRSLAKEHQAYSEAIRLFAEKKIKISGRKTIIS